MKYSLQQHAYLLLLGFGVGVQCFQNVADVGVICRPRRNPDLKIRNKIRNRIDTSGKRERGGAVCLKSSYQDQIRGDSDASQRFDDIDNDKGSAIQRNQQLVTLGRIGDWNGILELYTKEGRQFNAVNFATAFHQIARTQVLQKNDPRLDLLSEDIAEQLKNVSTRKQWKVRQIANLVYALAKMDLKTSWAMEIFETVRSQDMAVVLVENGNSQEVANLLWAFATMSEDCPHLMQEIESNAWYLVKKGEPQAIANAVWAFAKLGVRCPSLHRDIESKARFIVRNGKPQNAANTVWALATLGFQCPNLLGEIEANASFLVEKGSPQEVANIVWAFATCGVACPNLTNEITANARRFVRKGSTQAIANVVWSFATLGVESTPLMEEIEANASFLVRNGSAQELANTLWAFATLGVQCPSLMRTIESNVSCIVNNSNPQTLANAIWAFAKLSFQCPNLTQEIEARASFLTTRGSTQAIANTAWALASLGFQCPNLMKEVDANASFLVENGKPQEISATVWASATVGVKCPRLMKKVDENAPFLVNNGTPQAVSNTIWAFAALGVECPLLMREIEAKASLLSGDPQAVANSAWAFARLGVPCPKLADAVEANAPDFVTNGKPQGVSMTVWAFAKLNQECPSLLREIEANPSIIVDEGSPQSIANTIWAFATLGADCPSLMREIETTATFLIENGKPQDIASTVWAFAKLGFPCPNLTKGVEANPDCLRGEPRAIVITIWSLATLGFFPPNLISELEQNSLFHFARIDAQLYSTIAVAFAKFGYRTTATTTLFSSIQDQAESLAQGANDQTICNICHSLAILDLATEYENGFRRLWDRAIQIDCQGMDIDAIAQLWTTYEMVSPFVDIPSPSNLATYTGSWHTDTEVSRTQEEVSNLLTELKVRHESEWSPFPDSKFVPGLLAVDAVCKDQKIAIEFDGPTHFLREAGTGKLFGENGPTKAKRRILERLGWVVVNLSFFEWEQCGTKSEKKELLAQRLKRAYLARRDLETRRAS